MYRIAAKRMLQGALARMVAPSSPLLAPLLSMPPHPLLAVMVTVPPAPTKTAFTRFFSSNVRIEDSQDDSDNDGHEESSTTSVANGTAHDADLEKEFTIDPEDDEEMEQEEMFVEPHEDFEFRTREWGGPRRGGRLPEPTRYGDWERKGRCTDF